jgi:tRNA (cmo5U34)-methyltransferase
MRLLVLRGNLQLTRGETVWLGRASSAGKKMSRTSRTVYLPGDSRLRYKVSMSNQHSVQTHLGTAVADYDRVIRTFIPGYEQMLSTIVWWLSEVIPPDGQVIELGCGTGALAIAVLTKLPKARLEIWDIDPQMLAVARDRLQGFGNRVIVREQSFTEKMDHCNAVIATLSLHHLPTLDAKRAVYKNIFKALSKPGIFLNGDCTMDLTEPGHSVMLRYWVAFMAKHGITEGEARKHFSDWAKEDTYHQISDEFTALAQAGFRRPEVFWKEGPIAAYGGIKA